MNNNWSAIQKAKLGLRFDDEADVEYDWVLKSEAEEHINALEEALKDILREASGYGSFVWIADRARQGLRGQSIDPAQ